MLIKKKRGYLRNHDCLCVFCSTFKSAENLSVLLYLVKVLTQDLRCHVICHDFNVKLHEFLDYGKQSAPCQSFLPEN